MISLVFFIFLVKQALFIEIHVLGFIESANL